MFSSSRNILITGGSFSQVNHVKSSFEKLQEAASPAAFYNSAARFDPPKCHPNTRLAVLNRVMQWILGNEHKDELIMWLYGSAGAGKSAIAQSIAEQCAMNRILLASFFFSRTDTTRNHANSLFPTLAYQIASMYPEARGLIEAIVEEDPLVFSRSIEVQLELLVMTPLRRIFETSPTNDSLALPRHLIIIDGLDECQDPALQCTILDAIARTSTQQRVPLIFLIASRPEQDITMTFNQISTVSKDHQVVTRLALDDSYGSSADIKLFLRDKFKEIRKNHPLKQQIPALWPSDAVIKQLVAKSSGQFIYASTVVKYVKSIRHRPTDRLEKVLGIRSGHDLPFAELDALYTQILSSVEDIELVYDIIILMMIPNTFEDTNDMETLLFLTPGDILLLLGDLSSIISCPADYTKYRHNPHRRYPWHRLSFLHASLTDFLLDQARSKDLFINPGLRHARLLDYCMRHLDIHPFKPVGYVGSYIDHFCSIAAPTPDLRQKIWNFSFLQHWQDALPNVVYSVRLMENFLSGIKKLKVDNAEQMYNHHLKQLDQFWMSILPRFFMTEDPKFDFLLILAQYGLDWRVNLNAVQEGMQAETLVIEFYNQGKVPSFPGSRKSIYDPYSREKYSIDVHSAFWQFLQDPSRAGKYVVDGAKYATAASVYIKCLINHKSTLYMMQDAMAWIIVHLRVFLERSAKSDELVNLALQSQHPGFTDDRWRGEPAIVEYLKRTKALPLSQEMTT